MADPLVLDGGMPDPDQIVDRASSVEKQSSRRPVERRLGRAADFGAALRREILDWPDEAERRDVSEWGLVSKWIA